MDDIAAKGYVIFSC